MNFSEKLMKLRKEQLLSQEELGEKLNVTRQTVSKWELGQTTPDMEKLVEMSKLFNVSLDELTSDSDINVNTTEKESNNSKRTIIIILVLIGILCITGVIVFGKILGTSFGFINNIFNRINTHQSISNQMLDNFNSIQNKVSGQLNLDNFDEFSDMLDSEQETVTSSQNDWDKKDFNRNFEIRAGTKTGPAVQWLIDDVIQNNQTNERLVTVKYNDQEVSEPADLRTLKRSFDSTWDKFEVYFEYGEDGYIYKAIIEKI